VVTVTSTVVVVTTAEVLSVVGVVGVLCSKVSRTT
jgi:hypothetical protein